MKRGSKTAPLLLMLCPPCNHLPQLLSQRVVSIRQFEPRQFRQTTKQSPGKLICIFKAYIFTAIINQHLRCFSCDTQKNFSKLYSIMAAGQHFEVTVPSDMKEGLKLNNGQMMPIVGLGYV